MKKRSVKVSGHLTSVSLEEEFWQELKRLAKAEKLSLNGLIEKIDKQRSGNLQINLSSALRVYVLRQLRRN
ncbi:MAG TPA: ribbon-helix-helix domain-containing protein [Alphaproteobacteria bacterium]|nr:ribbon-helix-helix domain-containing protein [Micavibrio sp.]MBK9563443.1 ribbon-helix-helix domain-containing protein [Micavibrio sp.]HQX27527.1 ribbon-helix-helix domain-containing protein [Alphaproteobacteria bacterium]